MADQPTEEAQAMAASATTQTETNSSSQDPLHIGNLLIIVSDQHGLTIGRVAYRDATLVRVIPQEASDRAIEFKMVGDGMEFAPELGVSEVELLERQESDYYVDFLGARPGEILETFTVGGEPTEPSSGVVAEIIKTPTRDAIRLEDGRVLEFGGRGPELPIAVIRVRTAANIAAEEAGPGVVMGATDMLERQAAIMELLAGVEGIQQLELIPTAERSYPDALQHEELFQDLLSELSEKQKTNPRRIRYLEREVDLALSLKNNVVSRNEDGTITGVVSQEVNTFGDAALQGTVPALVPIVDAPRVLYTDLINDGEYDPKQVTVHALADLEAEARNAEEAYLTDSGEPNEFYSYIYTMLAKEPLTLERPLEGAGADWIEDQDVIRTAGLGASVQGLSANLPPGDPDSKIETDVGLAFLISNVDDRSVRAVGPMRYYNHRTAETHQIAPSDPSKTAGYVVLPPKAAITLRPPSRPGDLPAALIYSAGLNASNLPTITKALADLYSPDTSPQHAWTLEAGAADEFYIADWLRGVLRYAVHPSESLGPRTSALLGVLDTLGAGNRTTSIAVASVINKWVAESQAQWRKLLIDQRDATKRALDEEAPRVFQSVTGADSPLWPALMMAAPLQDLLADISRRNPAIAEAPTLMSAALTQEAQGDAAPLVWTTIAKMDARPIALDEKTAESALASSRAYTLRRKALRDIALLRLRGEPEINPCEHVKTLEAIRNLPDVLQRSRLLREFIEEYQGPKRGEWMTCTLCQQEAVCYHELMELEALAQPTRMEAIQKQMLIRYSGGRYEGKIVCKNCGQGLQELDYDEHVEFDDEGRPIMESSVLTDEQLADPEETEWQQATKALVSTSVEFTTTSQQEISQALLTMAERAGIILTDDAIRNIVSYADLYVSSRAPPAAKYEKMRAAKMVSASTKIQKTTGAGVSAAQIDVPTYAALIDQLRVAALMALLAIEMEISDPPLTVANQFALCEFKRGGWPMNPAAGPEDPGCLKYIACATAYIQRDNAPWRNMMWAGISKPETRVKNALAIAWSACQVIYGIDKKLTSFLSFTPDIRARITEAREDTEAQERRVLISNTDQLPVGFRPEPFPYPTLRPTIERDPLPQIQSAIKNETVIAPELLESVASATRQQGAAIVGDLHDDAVEFVKGLPTKPENMKDFVCCAKPIRDVEAGELLGMEGNASLIAARNLLRGAVPTAVNAGTHLWQEFQPAVAAAVEKSLDQSVFFKLFLKYCYTGPAVGEAHEFSVGNICRQCGMALGKPPDQVNFGTEGAAILAAQQGDLRVEPTEAAFEALSGAVRRRRMFEERETPEIPTWIQGLKTLKEKLEESESPAYQQIAEALNTVLEQMDDTDTIEAIISDNTGTARIEFWEPLTNLLDNYRVIVDDRIGPSIPAKPGALSAARAKEAMHAFETLSAMTEEPFLEGPRALQEYWCAKTQATASNFSVEEAQIQRWFGKKASSDFKVRVNNIVATNSKWYSKEAKLTDTARQVLANIGKALGPVLQTWMDSVRRSSTKDGIWGDADAQMLLRLIVMGIWAEAITVDSWIFEELDGDATEMENTATIVADWTRALMVHARQQFVRYSKDKIKQVLQQRAEMERTAIVAEILGQNDDDLRAVEFMKKTYKIGRWALGKNLRAYDADLLDAEVEQRRAQGIVETVFDPVLLESQRLAAAEEAGQEEGYDVNQGAAGDDY